MILRVSEVRITIPEFATNARLLAYADAVVEGSLLIRNIKVVEATTGRIVVSMPSRKVGVCCEACKAVVPGDSRYCSQCGMPMEPEVPGRLCTDLVSPLSSPQRDALERPILEAYLVKYLATRRHPIAAGPGWKPLP